MKVLLAHNFYRSSAPSGEDAVYQNEKLLLESNGVEVIPFELFNDDINDDGILAKVSIAANTIWSNKTHKSLEKLIAATKPDIAHFHNTFPQISPSAYAACKKYSVPVIQTIHNYRLICPGALLQRNNIPCEDCVGGSLLPALQHRCYRNSISATSALVSMLSINRFIGSYRNNVDYYIALTEFASSRLIAGGLAANKILIKPNFLPNPPSAGKGSGSYAVYVGRLSEEKGIKTLLTAWTQLGSTKLIIIGDGPLKSELESYVKLKNLNIEFMGYQDRKTILSIVSEATVQIVPSEWYEGFPMVILEAFSCGTPVIASRIGSLEEIIQPGVTGDTFAAGNISELKDRINKIFKMVEQEPNRYQQLRADTRMQFEKNYTEKQNFNLLNNIYLQAINSVQLSKN